MLRGTWKMTSKEALSDLSFLAIGDENHTIKCKETIEKDLDQLEEYRKIEEELGIDLITLFNIDKQLNTKKEIWFKIEDEIDASYRYDGDYYIIDLKHKAFVKIVCEPIDYFYFKDYGKTWALTKEELENDN